MKTLIFASVVFTLCIVAVILNCIYITSTTDHLLSTLNEGIDSPKDYSEILNKFENAWEKNRFIISVSVNRLEIEEVDRLVARAKSQLEISDTVGLETTLGELSEAITDIIETEKLSLEGIL